MRRPLSVSRACSPKVDLQSGQACNPVTTSSGRRKRWSNTESPPTPHPAGPPACPAVPAACPRALLSLASRDSQLRSSCPSISQRPDATAGSADRSATVRPRTAPTYPLAHLSCRCHASLTGTAGPCRAPALRPLTFLPLHHTGPRADARRPIYLQPCKLDSVLRIKTQRMWEHDQIASHL